MLAAILALCALATVFGLVLGYAAVRYKVQGDPLVDKIDALLPQTQCGQCTYPGCRPYAQAIAKRFDLASKRLGLRKRGAPLRTDLFRVPASERRQMDLF